MLVVMDAFVAAAATWSFQRRPGMVVASPGEMIVANCPTRRDCASIMFGDPPYGASISPTSRRMGLGR